MRHPNAPSAPVASAGRHLPVELLRRYVAGELAPPEQHRVEAHTLDCPHCADILEGLELQPARTTEASLGELRQRLSARVAELSPEKQPNPPLGWAWQQLAAAAVLLLTLGAAVTWIALRHPLAGSSLSRPVASQPATTPAAPANPPAAPAAPAEPLPPATEAPTVAAVTPAAAPLPPPTPQRPTPALARRGPVARAPRPAASPSAADVAPEAGVALASSASVAADSVTKPLITQEPVVAATTPASPEPEKMGLAKRRMAAVAAAPAPAVAGIQVVQGRITDQTTGEGMAGTTVLVAGTSTGTVTAADGSFSLPVPVTAKQLTVSAVGYASLQLTLPDSAAPLALALVPDTKQLSEVVVVRREAPPAPMSVGAMPAGGFASLKKYLRDSLNYPEKDFEARREGTVKLRFVVGVDGKLSDIKVVKGFSEEADAEAIRLLQEGPAWFPAIQNGRRLARTVEINVPFKIEQR